ncbi:hypothetical protein B5G95_15425, partial [Listeria monocytogenes]|nr:hypothetical protein [Listeria monocytogenes]
TTKNAIYLEDVNYQIKCKPNDLEDYHVFYIYDHYKDMATGLLYVKAKSRTGKLGNRTVKKVVIQNKTGIEAMALLHDGMDLESDIQLFCDITAQGSTTFEVSNPLECIKGIEGSLNQVYGGEIKHEPFKLSLLKRRGKDNVTTIRYRKNLEGLKIELNWDGLVTRIFPYADIQNKEGETERIYGDKVDSQYIGNYDGEVYARYVQFTEEQGATDLKSLNSVAKKYFTSMNRGVDKPKVSADVEIRKLENNKKFAGFRELGLFDTFTVYHERYNIDLELTVNKIEYDALSERVQSITAGDPKFTFFEQQESQFTEVMKKVPTKSYNSVFIDYVTQIISGNDGGNVIWWPKNRPTDLFFVDGETLEDSKQVLRINKSGIGFSSNGWKGPFDTAWTLDGVFVADFIRAGILSGILVQGVALKTLDDKSFQVVVEGGKVSFEKKVVSTGLDDVHGESLGAITSTYGADKNINGFAIWKEPNYIFSINTGDGDGKSVAVFQIPKESTPDAPLYRLSGEGTFRNGKVTFEDAVAMNGRLDVKELYVNGVKIDQNGGGSGGNGGGWNGQYPPEVTSDRDKRYWQIWAMFIGAGGTQQAAAALLGNAQGESDANPTADEGNGAPGFGYGVWQWTDGTGATSGRVYMINLMTRAGISGDPDTITTQFKLLMWHAPNGQWIATSAYPYTWSQFMNMSDIAVATRAFEENFERPLNDHPERITWANEWYLKFKDLDIPQSSGYIVPIDAPVTVTSEFGWRTHPITGEPNYHNGIDLVNNNSNAPIYASADGEVIVAGDANYFDWYGNWVVIKHSDGMYTGYAHLSSVKVSKGSTVTQGQQIGVIGTTGPSTGIHLHFQFFDEMYPSSNDHFFNPRNYINF